MQLTKNLIVIGLLATYSIQAQVLPKKNYPKNYFTWPVQATKALAANFGELRPNHYHMGLDCKTDQRENVPVIAAADGYIAKVKIEPFGFGRCIYINHPNGLTTLYAHLNDFYPALEKYIKEQQYAQENWRIFLENIPADLFPVKKRQFIAYSGNTGGSQGPHLHFEIRDTQTDKVLNPLLFGFPVTDNIPPDILRLAVYDRCISIYEQSPKFYPLKKVNGVYTTVPALLLQNTDRVSFAITSYDRYTGSTNQNGIYQAVLYDNETPVSGFQLDSIDYNETRYLNAHIDYKLKTNGGPYVQHLSRLPGYPPSVYTDITGDGVIHIDDDARHEIKIAVQDADGNTSLLQFAVQRSTAKAYPPSATNTESAPKLFVPGYVNVFENSNVGFYLPANYLYDSVRFQYKEIPGSKSARGYQLHTGNVPVHGYFTIHIKNNLSNPEKTVMRWWWGSKDDYKKTITENGWSRASFRTFGNYELVTDTQPPVITPVGFTNGMNCSKLSRLVFTIRDDTEELVNFRAELDGQWLRFSNDKGKTFIYKFDEKCPTGKHELKLSVEDLAGNKTERIYTFTR